jgi:hypothetical protein
LELFISGLFFGESLIKPHISNEFRSNFRRAQVLFCDAPGSSRQVFTKSSRKRGKVATSSCSLLTQFDFDQRATLNRSLSIFVVEGLWPSLDRCDSLFSYLISTGSSESLREKIIYRLVFDNRKMFTIITSHCLKSVQGRENRRRLVESEINASPFARSSKMESRFFEIVANASRQRETPSKSGEKVGPGEKRTVCDRKICVREENPTVLNVICNSIMTNRFFVGGKVPAKSKTTPIGPF